MQLQKGSRGAAVRDLQLKLKALGFDPGDIDGVFGKLTEAALLHFQQEYESLDDSGILDAESAGALDQALAIRQTEPPDATTPAVPVPCSPEIWTAFLGLVETMTKSPVRYGPGRALFKDGRWIVTHGPGSLGSKSWKNHRGASYPSFHCTSWTNFFLSWLLRYNERFTHAGNIPSLFTLLEASEEVHKNPGAGDYRGYGPYTTEIVSNGETTRKKGKPKGLDIREIYNRRATLPTFLVCGQSTFTENGWKTWHHTVLFAIDHAKKGTPMHRIAADGFKNSKGYSGKAMEWIEIDPDSFSRFDNCVYRVWGIDSPDGEYGDPTRPIAKVTLEP